MKIAFTKVSSAELAFDSSGENYEIFGTLSSVKRGLVKVDSTLRIHFDTQCDRCGEEMTVDSKTPFSCLVSDGSYEGFDENLDVIESFDGFIDFDDVAESEINMQKSDYNYCQTCLNKGE